MPEPSRRCLLLLAVFVAACAPMQGGVVSAMPSRTPVAATTPTLSPVTPGTVPPTTTSPPTPTATPDPSLLDLEATSCPGGVVLDWSASTHPEFHHYTALRSPQREIAPDYPPIAPAVDWGDSYATDRFVTATVDASIIPSDTEWNYRVVGYDAQGRVVAASPVRTAQLLPPAQLGHLRVEVAGTAMRVRWQPYDGPSACFSSYRVLYGTTGSPNTLLSVVSRQEVGAYEIDALQAGTTYQLRVRAVRDTTLGSFVLGETEMVSYTVP